MAYYNVHRIGTELAGIGKYTTLSEAKKYAKFGCKLMGQKKFTVAYMETTQATFYTYSLKGNDWKLTDTDKWVF